MIFENGKKEYIFIYSDYYKKTINKISTELINKDSKINKKNKNIKFHLINNTIPELKLNSSISDLKVPRIYKSLNYYLYDEGYQILSIRSDIVIGVLEDFLILLLKMDISYLILYLIKIFLLSHLILFL